MYKYLVSLQSPMDHIWVFLEKIGHALKDLPHRVDDVGIDDLCGLVDLFFESTHVVKGGDAVSSVRATGVSHLEKWQIQVGAVFVVLKREDSIFDFGGVEFGILVYFYENLV